MFVGREIQGYGIHFLLNLFNNLFIILVFTKDKKQYNWQCLFHLKPPYKLTLKPSLLLNNGAGMIECAKQGIGIIQLPLYLLNNALQEGELIKILKNYQADRIPVCYYYPRYRYIQPKVRKFIDFFLQEK